MCTDGSRAFEPIFVSFFFVSLPFFFGRDVGGEAQTESILLISFFDTDFFFCSEFILSGEVKEQDL